MDDKTFSLEDRILCADGACIGLVGSDGHCKLCGKIYEGDVSLVEKDAARDADQANLSDDPGPMNKEIEALKKELEEQDLKAENELERTCCPDDTCIGIIGVDGKCGTCGKQS
jgi:hypothetical protein